MFDIRIKQWAGRKRHALIRKTLKEVSLLIMKDKTLADIKCVEVRVLRKLSSKGSIGSCDKKEDNVYVIEIKGSLDRKAFISTLAHEVAHVNQFAEKRLENGTAYFIWNSSVLNGQFKYDIAGHTHEQYLAWPWELEARGVEESYMNIIENRTPRNKSQLEF